MANHKQGKNHDILKQRVLFVAAKYFLEQGYINTTMKSIATGAGLSLGTVTNLFGAKEDILCGLVQFVIEEQFKATGALLQGITEDKLLFYAAETVLQLHIVEMNEQLRELYNFAYTLPHSSALLQKTITSKLELIFGEHLPDLETKDFFKLEIATGGIMRGFMTVPCDMWFTMEQKVESFLETTLLIYRVPTEKIREAIAFVGRFDFARIAQETIRSIILFLEEKQKELF